MGLSFDGKRVALNRSDPQMARTTSGYSTCCEAFPCVSPPIREVNQIRFGHLDGSRIVFTSNRDGVGNLYQKLTSGGGSEELLRKSSEETWADDWTADGRFIVYQTFNPKTKWDLWILPMSGDQQPIPYLQTQFNEQQAQVSPDGKWIVYTSDESGTTEIYAQTFPAAGGKVRVSTDGGCQPTWRRDGRELFYIATDRKLIALDVKPGTSFEAGAPKTLFETRVLSLTDFRNHYAVSADGQRFLINSNSETTATLSASWLTGRRI